MTTSATLEISTKYHPVLLAVSKMLVELETLPRPSPSSFLSPKPIINSSPPLLTMFPAAPENIVANLQSTVDEDSPRSLLRPRGEGFPDRRSLPFPANPLRINGSAKHTPLQKRTKKQQELLRFSSAAPPKVIALGCLNANVYFLPISNILANCDQGSERKAARRKLCASEKKEELKKPLTPRRT